MPRIAGDPGEKPSRVRPDARHVLDKAAAKAKIAEWLSDPEKPEYIPRNRDEMHVLMRTLHDYCGRPVREIAEEMTARGCPVDEQGLQSCLRKSGYPSVLPPKAFEAFVRIAAADAFTDKQIGDLRYACDILTTQPGLSAEPRPDRAAEIRRQKSRRPDGWEKD